MSMFRVKRTEDEESVVLFNRFCISRIRAARVKRGESALLETFRLFGWHKSLKANSCVDIAGGPVPWYTYPAIEYLGQFDYSEKSVFEYGCGNSSLWWANRARFVASVENDCPWYESRKAYANQNFVISLCERQQEYCSRIENYDPFDVIVIDGHSRDVCAEYAVKRIRPDGMIILDNSDRVNSDPEYQKAMTILESMGFFQVDFFGFGPLNTYTWNTTVFFSRTFSFPQRSQFHPVKGVGNL